MINSRSSRNNSRNFYKNPRMFFLYKNSRSCQLGVGYHCGKALKKAWQMMMMWQKGVQVFTSQSLSEVFGSHLSLFVWISHRLRRSGSAGNRKNCGVGFVLELVVQFGAAHPVILVSVGERDWPTNNEYPTMRLKDNLWKRINFWKRWMQLDPIATLGF